MQPNMTKDIVIKALLMAVWWRSPKQEILPIVIKVALMRAVIIVSLTANNLVPSMSRRVHCLDNAVAEIFFHSLKTKRVKRKVYENRNEARADLFDYIEMFYNRKRHTT